MDPPLDACTGDSVLQAVRQLPRSTHREHAEGKKSAAIAADTARLRFVGQSAGHD
jgi:hypothetical protein